MSRRSTSPVCTQIGEREQAFAALQQALAERSPMLVMLKVDRARDGIRDDRRFAAVVRQVGIRQTTREC